MVENMVESTKRPNMVKNTVKSMVRDFVGSIAMF